MQNANQQLQEQQQQQHAEINKAWLASVELARGAVSIGGSIGRFILDFLKRIWQAFASIVNPRARQLTDADMTNEKACPVAGSKLSPGALKVLTEAAGLLDIKGLRKTMLISAVKGKSIQDSTLIESAIESIEKAEKLILRLSAKEGLAPADKKSYAEALAHLKSQKETYKKMQSQSEAVDVTAAAEEEPAVDADVPKG